MGADVRIVRVPLTASDETGAARLNGQRIGGELERELANSARKARLLDDRAPADTIRVVTDGRSVVDIAEDLLAATEWVNRP